MGHLMNMLSARTGSGISAKSHLAYGKIRRLCLGLFRSGYVESRVSLRQGQCLRCGRCCKLLYICPHLEDLPDGTTSCRIHEHRPINCRIFPLNEADLKDRDLIQNGRLNGPCGFYFPE